MKTDAILTDDLVHRYGLSRIWDDTLPKILFICLNPSRAGKVTNDATIVRCMNFSKDWGYGGMLFANLYSYRTPYVKGPIIRDTDELEIGEPEGGWQPLIDNLHIAVGPRCNEFLQGMIDAAEKVVCAWGNWKFTQERIKEVLPMINKKAFCMGRNKDGSPKHPLYLKSTTQLQNYAINQ